MISVSSSRSDSTTDPGRNVRWNFNGFLSGLLLPGCIIVRRELAPGARLLWAVLRANSRRDGYCAASDRALGKRLGVTSRQIRRYCRQLERAGFLETEVRSGTTARRYLLLHPCFGGQVGEPQDVSVRGVGQISPGVRTERSAISRKSKNIPLGERFSSVKVPDRGRTPTTAMTPAAAFLDGSFPPGEEKALKAQITALGFEATPELLAKLRRKVHYYNANGFVAAAEIARAGKHVAKSPANKPQGLSWFLAVVENALAARAGAARPKQR